MDGRMEGGWIDKQLDGGYYDYYDYYYSFDLTTTMITATTTTATPTAPIPRGASRSCPAAPPYPASRRGRP